jgi:hypothetical protein
MQKTLEYLKAVRIHGRQWFNNRGHLRILIAGAPKTGNMWLRMLLWHMYDLTQMDVTGVLSTREYPRRGSFVTHQHVLPVRELFAWGDPLGVRYITMLRHPGDMLLSLYHYVNNMAQDWEKAGRLGNIPSHGMVGQPLDGKAVREYTEAHFADECLRKSVAWIKSGRAMVVRYEDLHLSPENELSRLAGGLRPISNGKIHAAVEACAIAKLQNMAGPRMRAHYRKGVMGEWKTELPDAIVNLIAERYGDELEVMGYSFDKN